MTAYRMYFRIDDHIHGRQDFRADDDFAAIRIAGVLFDACSDICQSFELWQGERLIPAHQPHHLTDLTEAHQRLTIEMLEAISQSHWLIARSRRLIEILDGIKSKVVGATASSVDDEVNEAVAFVRDVDPGPKPAV